MAIMAISSIMAIMAMMAIMAHFLRRFNMAGVKVLFDTSTEEGKLIASIPRGSRKLFLEILINSFISQCKSRNVAPEITAFKLIQQKQKIERNLPEEKKAVKKTSPTASSTTDTLEPEKPLSGEPLLSYEEAETAMQKIISKKAGEGN